MKLPDKLRSLVKQSVALHGQVIQHELGSQAYVRIEKIRNQMAGLRDRTDRYAYRRLKGTLKLMEGLSERDQHGIAHAFSLMLELMNACENAYRTYRLRQIESTAPPAPVSIDGQAVIYVLTAHPTESRSPENIQVFEMIQAALTDALNTGFHGQETRLRHLLGVAWRVSTSRGQKPEVTDEADHIYSILLREETLTALVTASREITPVYVRTWVGGDKDGHPGIDEKVMTESLRRSRTHLLGFLIRRLDEVRATLALMGERPEAGRLLRRLSPLAAASKRLQRLQGSDGLRAKRFRRELRIYTALYQREIGELHPALATLERLAHMFPALVVPLELRESSELLVESARGKSIAIYRMIRELKRISTGGDPRWYARGLIISMTHEFAHVKAACKTVERVFGDLRIPVIPLFEDQAALAQGPAIVKKMLADPRIRAASKRHWKGFVEVMLGYSDSAKEMGLLASRLGIADSIRALDRVFKKSKIRPIFFHGSGGSVDRGGGSIQEQTAWWPMSALTRYKATIQGEMVERTFGSPEITRGGIRNIGQQVAAAMREPRAKPTPEIVRVFADRVRTEYQARVRSPEFLEVLQKATAYRYLDELRMGSRPTKRRTGDLTLASLRAIPWVLSWTQTRVLFPSWWGIGTAWKATSPSERRLLKRAYETDALFRSYVKLLGFTLAKVEMPIWLLYLENSGLPKARVQTVFRDFDREYRQAISVVHALSGEKDLSWFRPWLGLSIRLRSSMIHPLNLLQIISLKRGRDPQMIRETVTGIASGMLTTG